MKVRINKELCVGCMLCDDQLPEVFKAVDIHKGTIKITQPKTKEAELICRELAENCPAEAIIVV